MDCPTCEAMVDAYVDGELSASESADFERSLAACPECRRRLDAALAALPPRQRAVLVLRDVLLPLGPPAGRTAAAAATVTAVAAAAGPGQPVTVQLTASALAYGLGVEAPDHEPDDADLTLEPGGTATVLLHPTAATATFTGGVARATNLDGAAPIAIAG